MVVASEGAKRAHRHERDDGADDADKAHASDALGRPIRR